MTRRKIEYWVIPPQSDAEFVASMEQVLDAANLDADQTHQFERCSFPVSCSLIHFKASLGFPNDHSPPLVR